MLFNISSGYLNISTPSSLKIASNLANILKIAIFNNINVNEGLVVTLTCLSEGYRLPNGCMNTRKLYMDRSKIYLDVSWAYLEIRPADRPDAIGRKVDAGRKKHSNKAYFSRFSINLTYFPICYRLEILNEGRW